ncbi:hypothetical protein F2Q70_00043852 [Brassica cretica]|uniref:Uncharacterized protein n=1 Tax=Brassica cretica TaxID=69181 RepID=A0A8S9KN41_BRACR|nr:hypothetical protein F2Q70_00043852 [Brassica cretica]
MNFRGNNEDHQFVGKVLGIYRGRTSSGYFDGLSNGLGIFRWTFRWSNPRKFRRNVPQNFHREFPRNEALGKFRGMSPSVYSEEGVPREDGHDRAVEPTPQQSSLPEDPDEQERVQQREREEQEREMEKEMYGRSCGAKRNPESGCNPETGSPYHHDHDAVEVGSNHH